MQINGANRAKSQFKSELQPIAVRKILSSEALGPVGYGVTALCIIKTLQQNRFSLEVEIVELKVNQR